MAGSATVTVSTRELFASTSTGDDASALYDARSSGLFV
jgi:hypothetical protein